MNRESLAILSPNVATRREGTSRLLKKKGVWKNEIVDTHDGLIRFNELLAAGNGGLVFFTHPKKSDPFRVMNALIDRVQVLSKRRMVIPVAQHQHKAPLNIAGKILGVDTSHAIVTPHTMERGENKLHPSQKLPLAKDVFVSGVKDSTKFWDGKSRRRFKTARENFAKRNSPLPEAWGVKSYLREVIKGVPEGDVAVISAQGGRSDVLGKPETRNAIDPIFALLDKRGLENIPVVFVGIDPNPANLPPKEDHLFSKDTSRLRFNETLTMGEVRQRAQLEGISPAQFVFNKLGEMSRKDYVSGSAAA